MNEALIKRILQSPPLPTLPGVAIDVLGLAEDPDVALPALARVVQRDPALVAKILRTVNSSVYHLSHRIGNIDRALVVLGLEGVRTLVLGFSLVGDLKRIKSRGGFDHVAYWRRSLYAGAAARVLAEQFRCPLAQEAFLAELLMDIGMLALDRVLGKEYGQVTGEARSHDELAALEAEAFELTHADVAALLAERWKLPPELALPMARHHNPEVLDASAIKEVAKIVQLAGRCADVFADAEPALALVEVRRAFVDRYKLTEAQCDETLAKIGQRTKELAPLFEITLDEKRDYESVLKRASEGLLRLTHGGAAAAAGAPDNKRGATRFVRDGFIVVYPVRTGAASRGLRAQFRDASARGMGLSLQVPLQAGDQFVIRVPQKAGEPISILYSVVRCTQVAPNDHRIGAELVCVIRKPTDAPPGMTPPAAAPQQAPTPVPDRIRKSLLASK